MQPASWDVVIWPPEQGQLLLWETELRLCGAPWAGLAAPDCPDLALGPLPWEGARRLWGMIKVQTVRPDAPSVFRAGRGPWSASAAPRQWGGGSQTQPTLEMRFALLSVLAQAEGLGH